MSELKIVDLLHPDYVEFCMMNDDEQIHIHGAVKLLKQKQDLKKAMRDIQLMIDEVTTHLDDVTISKAYDDTFTATFINTLISRDDYQIMTGFASVYRALYVILRDVLHHGLN